MPILFIADTHVQPRTVVKQLILPTVFMWNGRHRR